MFVVTRWLSVGLTVALLGITAVGVALVWSRPSVDLTFTEGIIPSAFSGTLPLPEDEFQPTLEKAEQEVRNRHRSARIFIFWTHATAYTALAATLLAALLAAFSGRNERSSVEDATARTSILLRVVAVLVALGTGLNQVNQQLDSHATRRAESASELNDLLVETISVLYDSNSSVPAAKISLQRLREATERSW